MCSKTLQQARSRICADEEKGPIKNIPTRVSYATGVSLPPSISSPAGANTLLYLAQQLFPKRRVPRQPGHVSGGCWRGREDTAGTKQMPWLSAARGLCLGGSLLPWLLFLFLIVWLGAWAWFPSLSTACSGNNEGRHSRNRRRQRRQRSEPDSTTALPFPAAKPAFHFLLFFFNLLLISPRVLRKPSRARSSPAHPVCRGARRAARPASGGEARQGLLAQGSAASRRGLLHLYGAEPTSVPAEHCASR